MPPIGRYPNLIAGFDPNDLDSLLVRAAAQVIRLVDQAAVPGADQVDVDGGARVLDPAQDGFEPLEHKHVAAVPVVVEGAVSALGVERNGGGGTHGQVVEVLTAEVGKTERAVAVALDSHGECCLSW